MCSGENGNPTVGRMEILQIHRRPVSIGDELQGFMLWRDESLGFMLWRDESLGFMLWRLKDERRKDVE